VAAPIVAAAPRPAIAPPPVSVPPAAMAPPKFDMPFAEGQYRIATKKWPKHYLYMQGDIQGNVKTWQGCTGPAGRWNFKRPDEDKDGYYLLSPNKWPDCFVFMDGGLDGNIRGWNQGDPGPQGYWRFTPHPTEKGCYLLSPSQWEDKWYVYVENGLSGTLSAWSGDPGPQGWFVIEPLVDPRYALTVESLVQAQLPPAASFYNGSLEPLKRAPAQLSSITEDSLDLRGGLSHLLSRPPQGFTQAGCVDMSSLHQRAVDGSACTEAPAVQVDGSAFKEAPALQVQPVFCANHDRSEKRTKVITRSVTCSSCHSKAQTNYSEFALCHECSHAQQRCLCCGESIWPLFSNVQGLQAFHSQAKAIGTHNPLAAPTPQSFRTQSFRSNVTVPNLQSFRNP
jgi:hypothetical protein